jgi:hypothetical protein
MILTPSPLQRPSFNGAAVRSLRVGAPGQARPAAMQRPVLQTLRAPQQLCLDLQPRQRQE